MNEDRLIYIEVDKIHPHLANPRKDVGDVTELAESIKANGVLQNLTVVPYYSQVHKREMEGLYTVIIGHRRLAACKQAGITSVPCVITHMSDQEQILTMLTENMQRSDLTMLEEADSMQMMLDMGETVGSIAEQTGLSETTVRRRLNLTKLDRKQVMKAQERGATMQDYIRLEQIKNPEEKNEVLRFIGTQDFNQRVSAAMNRQKRREDLEQVIQDLRSCDWCEELTTEQRDTLKNSHIEYIRNYSQWSTKKPERPEDADKVSYFFYPSENQVDFYREITEQEKPMTSEERLRKDLRGKMDTICDELEYQDGEFGDLRRDFVEEFGAWEKYREEIQAFAVKAFLHGENNHRYNRLDQDDLGYMLNITPEEDHRISKEKLSPLLWRCPEKVLFYIAYLMLETGGKQWWSKNWNTDAQCYVPCYQQDSQLNLLYECLESLGYEISTQEQLAMGGARMAFQEAQSLLKSYQEELEDTL